jgi:hypothetical protein
VITVDAELESLQRDAFSYFLHETNVPVGHCYGYDYLYAGPLFTHQFSHVWIDFRGIQDAFFAFARGRC